MDEIPEPVFYDLTAAEEMLNRKIAELSMLRVHALYQFHRDFTDDQARFWLVRHGAGPEQAKQEFLQVVNARRAAVGTPPVGTCARIGPASRHVHRGAACFGDPDCPLYSTRPQRHCPFCSVSLESQCPWRHEGAQA